MKHIPWILLILFSCVKSLPDLSPIDLVKWKDDRGGCKMERYNFIEPLQEQIDELKGLSENEIIKLLGRPDRNELYTRNQKFYYYDLDPGKICNKTSDSIRTLTIRFNAMGFAKEVGIEIVN
jgi:hypothetical protein